MPIRRWLSERLDDAVFPLLKALSPGYRKRMAPFRLADSCEVPALGDLMAPREILLTDEPSWRNHSVQGFRFPSPITCAREENSWAYGRLITATPDSPWVVVVPGYGTGCVPHLGYSLFQNVHGHALLAQGISVALLDPPYHLRRTPRGHLSGEGFFSPDLQETRTTILQAAADAISLVRWLHGRSGRSVGVWGTSLGGAIAGLAAANLPELGAAVLMEPLDNPGDVLASVPGAREIRQELVRNGVTPAELRTAFAEVSPSSYQPALPIQRILFIIAQWDQIVPTRFQEAFWEAWGRPKRICAQGSHTTVATNGQYTEQAAEFLARLLRD